MRRYVILYRRGTGKWGRMTPEIHRGLYDRPEVNAAVAFLRDNPAAEGVAVRLEDETFNIMVVAASDEPNAFTFDEEATC